MSASQEIMNSCTNPSLSFRLSQIFKETFDCLPFVFKKITLKFGSIWFPLVFLVIGAINYMLLKSPLGFQTETWLEMYLMTMVQLVEKSFTVFIVPYFVYVFRNNQENTPSTPFWDFITETVYPLLINHVKALFVILFFGLFLIVPGIVKALRYMFITQATFFDDKDYQKSALQSSQELTKGHFLDIVIIILTSISMFIVCKLFFFALKPFVESTMVLKPTLDITKFIIEFYVGIFSLSLFTQAYFVFRKIKR